MKYIDISNLRAHKAHFEKTEIKKVYEQELKLSQEYHKNSVKNIDSADKAERLQELLALAYEMKSEGKYPLSVQVLNKKLSILRRINTLEFYLSAYKQESIKAKYNIKEKTDILKKISKINLLVQDLRHEAYDVCSTYVNIQIAKIVARLDSSERKINEQKDKNIIIDLKNVSKYYYNKLIAFEVLKNINLEINEGEFVVILGPSGSGKTTLLNIISGMDNATFGDVNICNVSLVNKNSSKLTEFRKQNVGYVFQQYGLLPNLTVRENIEIGSNLQKNTKKKVDIDGIMKRIGIYDFRNKMPYELSGGQQQRVSIARSLAKNPNIIFGDEPTGAVDTEMSQTIMKLFLDVNKKFHTTVVIVTHNAAIAQMATTLIKVNSGKLEKIIQKNPKSVDQID
jgi:putative ABC transport system ATP-binding protein